MKLNSIFVVMILFITLSLVHVKDSYGLKELNISTPDLARSSADIVVAKCVSTEAKLDEKTGFIFTYTTFEIDESLKGKYGNELILRIVGGTVGDKTLSSPFLPRFEPNEEVVLLLGPKNSAGYPVLQSVNKGIYRVHTTDSGAKVISTPVNGLELINSTTNQRINGNNTLSLDDFIYSINQTL